jgi:rhodanese-related sulfurtransferase
LFLLAETVMTEFTLNTPMKEVEARFPFSRSLLHAKFHVGGCATCGFEPHETIGEVAGKHAKDADAMVEALNGGIDEMRACEVSPAELAALLKDGEQDVLLLDVREAWEFELAHLKGSILLGESNMEQIFEQARGAAKVVILCHHGLRSLNATLFFRQNGVNGAKSLRGGLDAYAREIDPTLPRY